MDQTNLHSPGSSRIAQPPPAKVEEKPIPFDSVEAKPTAVSRQPLSLGGSHAGAVVAAPRPAAPAAAAAPKVDPSKAVPATARPAPVPVPVLKSSHGERITGMKTFFAKLHAGSLTFLEEQIQSWLKDNPSVSIKATTVTTGEVQAKVTEPNLIIVVWF